MRWAPVPLSGSKAAFMFWGLVFGCSFAAATALGALTGCDTTCDRRNSPASADGGVASLSDAPAALDGAIPWDASSDANASADAVVSPDASPSGGNLIVGFRASRIPIHPFPPPEYWSNVASSLSSRVAGSQPGGVWIVGLVSDEGDCMLEFPSNGASLDHVTFKEEDLAEHYLAHFDATGVSVWLQVEPGLSDVSAVMSLVMSRYGHHPSVLGFGLDVEWLGYPEHPQGRPVSDEEARQLRNTLRTFNPSYRLFLKHWLKEMMPPSEREGLLFINDSQGFSGLNDMVEEFKGWGSRFAPWPVAFQFGYENDEGWWSALSAPFESISTPVLSSIPNTAGLFWVDFTLTKLFPP